MTTRPFAGSLPGDRIDDKMDLKPYDFDNGSASAAASLRKILQMTAETPEEKFKILDARDKLYKIIRDKDPSVKRGALVATCPDMCPEKERLLRDYQGRGSVFEMTNFSKNSIFNHNLAIKEYARSSADQEEPLPHDLRPIQVLTMTMSHLLHNVADFCELTDDNLEDWYMFMWDRTRAIRKELTQQGVCNLESVTLVEQCARFHIHSAERLVDQDSSVYDDKINTENLTKCLQTLKYMYKDLAKEDIKCPNEPEFICYTLLLNLNNSSVFTELSNLSESVMTSVPVKFALDLMTAWETRNYIQFFKLVKKTTYLNCCLLRRYFGEMRLYAIKTMIRSYCTKTYSPQIVVTRFVENLNFEGEEECVDFLAQCNFNFHQVNGKTVVNFDRVLFQNPTSTLTSGRAYLFIEEKKTRPLSVVMAGGTLPPKLYENHTLQNSFTEDGVLKTDSLPKSELFDFSSAPPPPVKSTSDFKFDANKLRGATGDIFQKDSQMEQSQDQGVFKRSEETAPFSQTPLFTFKEPKPPTSNIFGSVQPSPFNKTSETPNIFGRNFQSKPLSENIFDSSNVSVPGKSIFGNQSSSFSFNNQPNVGSSEPKTFPTFSFTAPTNIQMGTEPKTFAPPVFKVPSSSCAPSNQIKSVDEDSKWKEEQERMYKERMEQERLQKEREEMEKRKKKEEERLRMILEEKRLQEENERKKREEQERERKRKEEERARLEREEKRRQEEQERLERQRQANAKRLAELKRLEDENKRRIELAYQQKVEKKMGELKKKIQKWKTKIIFEKWRMNTWSKIEERKMKDYFKEVKIKYPPVCTEEFIDGNPYGLLIPSTLTFEKFRNWRQEFSQTSPRKLLIVNEELPLLKIDSIVGKFLEERAKSLGFRAELQPFPWLLLISVPDELECPNYWKSIETFVEMHFVESYNWQFGVQKGPMYYRSSSHGTFRFKISIRKVRGSKLFEGCEPNPSATTGINALVFFVTDNGNKVTGERLKAILRYKASLPKIPIVIISLNGQSEPKVLEKILELEKMKKSHISDHRVLSVSEGKQQLVAQLIKSLGVAATMSAPPSSLRVCPISIFFTRIWLDIVWRRIEISLSNFKISMHEPKILIEFYNSCLDRLSDFFFDKSYDNRTILAEEFLEFDVKRPERTPSYKKNIMSFLNSLKLPHWPEEIPKSSHQLNYRIHQYCKKVAAQDKLRMKSLKWMLYRIIRKSLLWKGLDIYCDEDIEQIIVNFPWLQVFQEISRVLILQVFEKTAKDKEEAVIYDIEKIDNFSFEPSLISKFLKKSNRQKRLPQSFGEEEEMDDSAPCLEKDSIVYAYSVAIERESNKRKREESFEESIDALFSSPAEKRIDLDEEEVKDFNLTQIESSFQSISDRLDKLRNVMTENSKMLMDIQNSIL